MNYRTPDTSNESSRENQTDAETSTAALDCIYDVYISPEQAAMGHTRKLFINDRHYDVHTPGNLSDQQRIRMKGLGSSNGVTSGDLYIRVNIILMNQRAEGWWESHLRDLAKRCAKNYGP